MGEKLSPINDPATKISVSLPKSLINGMDKRRRQFRPRLKRSGYIQRLVAEDTKPQEVGASR